MARLATKSKAGFREVMGLRITHGRLFGVVWSPAPLDVTHYGELHFHDRPASRRECVWVAMSDGYVWYVVVDVETSEVLTAHTTRQACPVPVRESVGEAA